VPDPLDDPSTPHCAEREAGEIAAEHRPAMIAPKSSIATRKEMKVPKKPLASWMALVAMTSVPICARIDPLGRIALHRLAADRGTRQCLVQHRQARAPGASRSTDSVPCKFASAVAEPVANPPQAGPTCRGN
jgi:hypothetical protein